MTQMETGRQATSRNNKKQSQDEVIQSRLWLFACYQMLFHLDKIHLIDLREEPETIIVQDRELKVSRYRIQPSADLKYRLKTNTGTLYEKSFCLENSMKEISSLYESHGFRDMQMVFVHNRQKLSEDFNTSFDELCLTFEKDLSWLEKRAKESSDKIAKSELMKAQRYFKVMITVFTIIVKGYHLKLDEDQEFLELLKRFFNKRIIYNKRLSATTRVMTELRPLISYVFTKAFKEFENLKEAFEANTFDSDIIPDTINNSSKMDMLDKEIYLKINGNLTTLKLEDALIEIAYRMNNSKYEELVKLEICEEHIPLVKKYTDKWDLNDIFLQDNDLKHLSIIQESRDISNSTLFKKYVVYQPKLLLFFTSHFAMASQFVTRDLYGKLKETGNYEKKYNMYFSYIYSNLTKQMLMIRLSELQKQFSLFSNTISLIQLNEYNAFANYIKGGCYKLDLRIYSALRYGDIDSMMEEALRNFLIALEATNVSLSAPSLRILSGNYNAFVGIKEKITDRL